MPKDRGVNPLGFSGRVSSAEFKDVDLPGFRTGYLQQNSKMLTCQGLGQCVSSAEFTDVDLPGFRTGYLQQNSKMLICQGLGQCVSSAKFKDVDLPGFRPVCIFSRIPTGIHQTAEVNICVGFIV